METKRILVCGGRDYTNKELVYSVLNAAKAAHNIECIISGMAQGADTFGSMWAIENNIPLLKFPADWKTYGGAAGPIRNQQMLNEGKPNLIFAFPGKNGTKNMIKIGKRAGIVVLSIKDEPSLF